METNWWPSCSTGSSNEPGTWHTKRFQIRGNQLLVSCAFDSFHLELILSTVSLAQNNTEPSIADASRLDLIHLLTQQLMLSDADAGRTKVLSGSTSIDSLTAPVIGDNVAQRLTECTAFDERSGHQVAPLSPVYQLTAANRHRPISRQNGPLR